MKKLRNYVLMAAAFAILVGIVSGITAGPAIAQAIKAALVRNVDEPGRQPFEIWIPYDQFGCSSNCVNFLHSAGGGTVLFDTDPPVPANMRWIITGISGTVPSDSTTGDRVLLQSQQVTGGGAEKFGYYGPFFTFGGSPGFSSSVFTTVEPGQRAHLNIHSSTINNFGADITLNGYLISATN